MALNNLGMGIVFTAQDYASNVVKQLSGNIGGLDNAVKEAAGSFAKRFGLETEKVTAQLGRFAAAATIAAAGAATLGVLFGSTVSKAADLEQVMLEVQQKTNLADADIQSMTASFLDLSAKLPVTAVQLARVGVIAGQLGISSTKGIEALALVSAQLAQVSDLSEEASANALSRLSTFFEVPIEQAGRLGSVLIALGNTSKASESQIVDTAIRFAGLAKAANLSAHETAAFAASLIDAGLQAEEAGSAMSRILTTATEKSAEFGAALGMTGDQFLKALGADAAGTLTRFFGTFTGQGINEATARLRTFGLTGVGEIKAVLGLAGTIDGLRSSLAGAAVAFQEGTALQIAFDSKTRGFNARMAVLRSALDAVAIQIGNVLLPVATALVDVLVRAVQAFFSLPEPIRRAAVVVATLTAGLMTVVGTGAALAAILPTLKVVGAALLAAALPAIKLIAVLALVAGALYGMKLAWDANLGGIQDLVLPVITKVSNAIQSLFTLISTGRLEGGLAEWLGAKDNRGALAVVSFFSQAWAAVEGFFSGVKAVAGPILKSIFDDLAPIGGELASLFGELFDLAVSVIVPLADLFGIKLGRDGMTAMKILGGIITFFVLTPLKILVGTFAMLVRGIVAVARVGVGFFQALVDGSKATWAAVGQGLRDIYDYFPGVFKFLGEVWDGFVAGLFAPWRFLGEVISGAFGGIANVVRSVVLAVAGTINDLLTKAAKVAGVFSPELAAKLEGAKIDTSSFAAPAASSGPATAPTGDPGSYNRAPGALGSPAAASRPGVPASGPRGGSDAALAAAQAQAAEAQRMMAEALARQASRPVVVQGDAILDGQRVGRVQGQQARDARARSGQQAPSWGRY